MPVYLLHGFRWPRPLIRIHIILQNLDDAAAEWLVAPGTTLTLLKNFNEIYPECMEHLNRLRFVEQYDPNDASSGAGSQPYAYVADMCEEITLGVDVDDVRGKGVPSDQWAAMMELRDKLAPEEKVAWYIVVCGDEDRWAPGTADSLTRGSSTGIVSQGGSSESDSNGAQSSTGNRQSGNETQSSPEEPQPKGLRKFFASALGRRRSRPNLDRSKSSDDANPPARKTTAPPVPAAPSWQSQQPGGDPQKPNPPRSGLPNITLQTQNLKSGRVPNGNANVPQSASSLSLIPDEDQEVITGPSFAEDPLSAPSPTVKHGKQHDVVLRQRRRSAVPAFATSSRPMTPDTFKTISPIVRNGSIPYAQTPEEQQGPPQADISEPESRNVSPPTSYVPTGAPPSVRTSRSVSPVKTTSRNRTNSRASALNALEGGNGTHGGYRSDSPARRSTRGNRSRRSSVQTLTALTPRQSQYSLSTMSGTVQALYGIHEQEYQHRQSVTQDDLVAKGLDNIDFASMR